MTNLTVKPAGLYIHIPFCRRLCRYCHFSRHVVTDRRGFIKALLREIHTSPYAGQTIDTVYWGGGTPSLLSASTLTRLMTAIRQTFVLRRPEITLEANPEDLTLPKLTAWRKLGINRLSVGVQTLTNAVLKNMGRRLTDQQIERRLYRAATVFPNLNVDLIIGLPGETETSWQQTVERIRQWPLTHLSAYFLDPEGARLHPSELLPERTVIKMQQYLHRRLYGQRWQWYEVSAWCRPGYQCRHNLHYWHHDNYLGMGAGAHSFWDHERWSHDGDLATYAHLPPATRPHLEQLSPTELDWEIWMTGLRTRQGVDLRRLHDRSRYEPVLTELIRQGVLRAHQWGVALRHWSRQVLFLDSILAEIVQKA